MRIYSSTVPVMELSGAISDTDTNINLNVGSLPTIASNSGNQMTLVIRPDTQFEEIVYVTVHNASSTSYTVLRGRESTAAQTHPDKAVVRHMITAADLTEPHYHINAKEYSENNNTLLHGLNSSDGKIVGEFSTNQLKNKTIRIGAPDYNVIENLTVSNVSGISGVYAPLASPNFTGTPQISGVNIATTATAPASHTHGNLTNDGKIGTSSGNVIVTGANGVLTALAQGSAGQFLSYNGTWQPVTSTSGVSSVSGTPNQITVSPTTGAAVVSLPSNLILPSGTTATTQASTDDSTKVATTAFVQDVFAGVSGGDSIARYVRSADTSNISSATAMFAASNTLTANTLYKFRYVVFAYFNYTGTSGTISFTHSFTQTPQEITWMFNNANDLLTGQYTVTTATAVSNSIAGSGGDYIEVEGYFKTNASSGGTFSPQVSTSAGSVNIKKGSFIELLSISAAGSWI